MTTITSDNKKKKYDRVQRLNYSAHAIEDLREVERINRVAGPETARVFRRLIDMLQHSVKFILPNCCNLIEPEELKQAHFDNARLPFSCVAFEAPWEKEDGIEYLGGFKQTPATKRIALCWEPKPEYELLPGLNSILKTHTGGGVFVVPIYLGPELERWTVSLGGAFLPYKNTFEKAEMESALPATRIANAAMKKVGLTAPTSKQYKTEPFFLLPELCEHAIAELGGDIEKLRAQILLDARDESMMMIQACSVINCANVTTTEVSAPTALNKKRQKKGKQPLFSYKVLQLTEERRCRDKDNMGGRHASPRMHLRRGHLRRLENKTIWVRPAMVNAGSKSGAVAKDYAVLNRNE